MDTRNSRFRQGFAQKVQEFESFGFRKCSWNFHRSLRSRSRVFSYYSYFMLKGHSMAIGFSPNHRAGSKAVWTVLLTVKRPVSLFVLVPKTSIS